MTWLSEITLALTYFAAGALSVAMFTGLVLVPRAYRKGRERTAEENRVYEGVVLARDHHAKPDWPKPQTPRDFDRLKDLPVQLGTIPEHQRRMRPPMRYVEITDDVQLALPAAPAPQRQARAVTDLAYRRAQALIALDRLVAPLRTSTGRHRAEDMPNLHGTVAQRRPSAAEAQRQSHLAWTTSTAEWPKLALAQGWTVPDIPPTVEFGELVT